MAENKTDSSKYTSKWGGGFITSAQFLCELVCENIAKKNKKKLFNQFWNHPQWTKAYQWQIICANRLLKKYHVSVLIKALTDSRVISLGAIKSIQGQLDQAQKEYENKTERMSTEEAAVDIQSVDEAPKKPFNINGKTVRNKLKDL